MDDMDTEMMADFLVEALEQSEVLDQELVELERSPCLSESLNSVFRVMHTLKGGAGFLSLHQLEGIAHRAETLLDLVRGGSSPLTRDMVDVLLEAADAIRDILVHIESTGREGAGDHSGLFQRLEEQASSVESEPAEATVLELDPAPTGPAPSSERDSALDAEMRLMEELQEQLMAQLVTPTPIKAPTPTSVPEDEALENEVARGGSTHVRVKVELLDKLMNLVGELVLSRNQMLQLAPKLDNALLTSASQRINLVTSELQEYVMQTRMQPVGVVLKKFPRLVRDLAAQTGKEVRLSMEGEETALDRTVIEAIKDPLTHVLRNSIDHGLEPPEERLRKGKPGQGAIHIKAYHEGGQVTIEFLDDGRGIDPNRVRERAIERGFLTREEASRLSEREVLRLVFRPGFSTAAAVTNLSGRGVGMDVVQSSAEKIGGSVDLSSVLGKGTVVKMRIPLTLAIIPALVIKEGGQRYAIPQVNLQELVRLEAGEQLDLLYGAEIYRLRGKLLPVLRLRQVLGLPEPEEQRETNLVVLNYDNLIFGLIVDGICDTEEIVVKPLSCELKQLQLFAGATIMGDGRVALIIDVGGLARSASMGSEVRAQAQRTRPEGEQREAPRQNLLTFTLGGQERFAIPLGLVSRLEEIPTQRLETLAGGKTVVQYREKLLSVFHLGELLGLSYGQFSETLQVLVFERDGMALGLVVETILDVVEEHVVLQRAGQHGFGLLGVGVVAGRATSFIDLEAVIASARPDWMAPRVRVLPTAREAYPEESFPAGDVLAEFDVIEVAS